MTDEQVQRKLNQLVKIANELDAEAKARYGDPGNLFFEAEGTFYGRWRMVMDELKRRVEAHWAASKEMYPDPNDESEMGRFARGRQTAYASVLAWIAELDRPAPATGDEAEAAGRAAYEAL